jgi:hypothetical protein
MDGDVSVLTSSSEQNVLSDELKRCGILLTFARSRMGAIDQGLGHQEVDACTRGVPSHLEQNSRATLEKTNQVVLNDEVEELRDLHFGK